MISPRGYLAGGTIPVSHFVQHDGTDDHTAVVADGTAPILGISQEGGKYAPLPHIATDPPTAAEEGDSVNVYMPGTYALVYVGNGGVTAGDLVKSDGDGQAVAVAEGSGTKEYVAGRTEQTVAAGGLALVFIAPQVLTTETS